MDEAGRVWRGFWNWWLSELLALLPTPVRGWLGVGLRGGWLLHAQGGWRMQRDPQDDAEVVGELDPERGQIDTEALRLARTGIYIALGREMVLERDIELPLAAQENLREVVGYELDRHTPFRSDQAWFDYRVLGRDTAVGKLRLRLFLAPTHVLEKLMQGLRDARLPVRGVLPLQAARDGDLQLNLLPTDLRDRPSRLPHLINLGLFLVLIVMLAMAAMLPLQRQQAALSSLQPQLETARAAAEETRRLRDALAEAGAAASFMPQRLQSRTDLLLVLEEVTHLLPDNTWLRQLEMKDGEIRLFGESAAAAELVTLLETSPMFADVGFRSPVTQDPRSGSERFQLGMRPDTVAGGRTVKSRWSALALLLALLAGLVGGLALPLWAEYEARNEAIADTRHRIAAYQWIAAGREVLRERQAAVERQQAGERLFLQGSTEALAAAELQSIASREIASVRGRLISTQVLPAVQDGDFRRVGIQVRMRAPLPAVYAMLETLYAARPVLFIDDVSLRQVVVRGPTRKGQVMETQLDFGFELRGYMRGAS